MSKEDLLTMFLARHVGEKFKEKELGGTFITKWTEDKYVQWCGEKRRWRTTWKN
jgi:hypothetical protein